MTILETITENLIIKKSILQFFLKQHLQSTNFIMFTLGKATTQIA